MKTSTKKIIGIVSGFIVSIVATAAITTAINKMPVSELPASEAITNQPSDALNYDADYDAIGTANRYMGIVEAQNTVKYEKDPEKTVAEIFVKEGQTVTKGTQLFSYDTESIQLKLDQAELDLQGFDQEITDLNAQITQLEKEKKQAATSEQFSYTSQIQEKQNAIARAEYNKKSKSIEIDQIKDSLNNSVVKSSIDGVIKSINESNTQDSMSSEPEPFMSILSTDNYKVKGTISELNVWTLTEGSPVVIRSRIDQTRTWTGTITKIDIENPVSDNNDMYFGGAGGDQATKYPFYIELNDCDDLILGQHVYIELSSSEEAMP